MPACSTLGSYDEILAINHLTKGGGVPNGPYTLFEGQGAAAGGMTWIVRLRLARTAAANCATSRRAIE
jgi:hypothetical protein